MTVHETRPSTNCLLLDISESGARLHTTSTLPDSFLLIMDKGLQKWCRVVRRAKNDIGVQFIKSQRGVYGTRDNRGKPRRPIERTVQAVSVNDSLPALDCTLLDISESGGRLRSADIGAIPDEFMLILRDDLRKWCRVVRRAKNEVGVRFVKLPAEPAAV